MIRWLAIALWLAAPAGAGADPLDEFGFGARASGLAGTYTANAAGADAAHHNPAGVAVADRPALLLGYSFGSMQLDINNSDAGVLDARGGTLGLAIPHRFGSVTAAFGLAVYMPDQFVARVQLVPAAEPHYGLLDNDPLRLVVEPVAAVRFGSRLAVGAGASLLTDAVGNGVVFDVGVEAGEKIAQAALDVELRHRVAPLLGVLYEPSDRVRIGASFRDELALDLQLDIVANVDVASVVTGNTLVSVRAKNYYTPRRATAGFAVDVFDDLTLSAELQWANWSRHPGLVADLQIEVNLDTAPQLVQTDTPPANFEDVVTPRVGAELRFGSSPTHYAVRTGYAFLPTPIPEQVGLTSIADNDRHQFAMGLGVTLADWRPWLVRPIHIDVALQWHSLSRRLTVKDTANYPGPAFSSGGDILFAGTTVTLEL